MGQLGFIYFAMPEGSKSVKIGFSANPVSRLRAIQVMNHAPVKMIAKIKGTQRDEQWLHRELKTYRIRGEWFKVSFEVLKAIFIAACLDAGIEPDMDKFLDWSEIHLSRGGNR